MQNVYHIYDLDGTVIDSDHRYRNKPDGSIDLDYWFANMVPEKIALDKPIYPLAGRMARQIATGQNVIICTARTMEDGDSNHDWLFRHGMYAETILHRRVGCEKHDADLKEELLDEHFWLQGIKDGLDGVRAIMYEDNLKVIERLRTRGVTCVYCGDGYATDS